MQNICRLVTTSTRTHYLHRRSQFTTERRLAINHIKKFSSSNSAPLPPSQSPKSSLAAKEGTNVSSSATTVSKTSQLLDSLASTASRTGSKAAGKTTEAMEVAADKAKTAAIETTNSIRHSIENATISAKQKGEQYAWETHRYMARRGEDMRKSARITVVKTAKRIKESTSKAVQSTTNRLKRAITQRMPKIPKLPFTTKKSSSATAGNGNEALSVRMSNALPSKETLVKSASYVATETLSKAASNVTTQVHEHVNKASRWLWWWGLAAVGVWGVTTTLTKEGVHLFKDLLTSKGGSVPAEKKNAEEADTTRSESATPLSDSEDIGVDNNNNESSGNGGR